MKNRMSLTLVAASFLCLAASCGLAATVASAEDGYVTRSVKKTVRVTEEGTKKGIDVTVGGTKKGLRTAGGGVKKGVKETKKFFRKVF